MRALLVLALAAACTSHGRGGEPGLGPGAAKPRDPNRVYVELNLERAHRRPLHDGAVAGLARIPFAVPLSPDQGGDTEIEVKVARLAVAGYETVCDINVLVMRLPSHELIGMAEGSARAGGTDAQAADDCLSHLGASLIGGKVRALLDQRLGEPRR